ncbi:alpha/beta fold hydrolase [Kutzneria kofuensis]|uniref:Pimeloyl-ACP methyl ester carboxylesterase n=1 Tax=Kutzneria kofuensis TaxID=103725 RepID=A0A7W9KJL8_9PSEU|nr:alpha/beta fold hydrolase [Kutzneria kofuensis]MBB5893818.1 pimeloyl-ACP methyl ester carboxylesterase [Kutzneria kofuensis]
MDEVITGDGLRLAVYVDGDAGNPTVLLVHGFPDTAKVWDPLVRELRSRFRVVRYDVRGVGGSEAPKNLSGFGIERLADDLRRVAEATKGPVHLVGHDWGAVQGWRAVAEGSFESFTAISGPDLGHASDWYRRNFPSRETLSQLARSWYMGAFKIPKVPDLFFPSNGLALYRANIGRKHEPRRITTRTLQIVPTRDRYVTPALTASAEPWCDDLTVKKAPAGHWVIRSHPELVASWITEFTLER